MKNLRLTNEALDKRSNREFYHNGLPTLFLSPIKSLNIIVGANNSRKSRFLREIIRTTIPVIIESENDINALYFEGEKLIDTLKKMQEDGAKEEIIFFSGHKEHYPSHQILDNYERTTLHVRNKILLKNITDLISGISENILQSVGDKDEKIVLELSQLKVVCRVILYLYEHIAAHNGNKTHYMSLPESEFQSLKPEVSGISIGDVVPMYKEILSVIKSVFKWSLKLDDLKIDVHKKKKIYIPVLRTSWFLGTQGDLYKKVIEESYFRDRPSNLDIQTGLELYDKIDQAKNGEKRQRTAFREFEKFIGLTFFKSDDFHIIAYKPSSNRPDNSIIVTIPGQRDDVPIYDLGDGIQGIINLLFPIFTANEGDWIFIDEPENHLHPGFQNIFIKAIAEHKFIQSKNLHFFINTHSNHILSEAFLSKGDTSILIFNNRDQDSSNIRVFEQDKYQALELLGVMNTSVFVTNCTVWVEGITDRLYIRAFLSAYAQTLSNESFKPNEGFDFSFIEYAGKNLVHYDFTENNSDKINSYFLNSNVFIIADSDFDKEKHKQYQAIKRDNFVYKQTNVPEIENLIPESVLKRFLLEKVKCDPSSIEALDINKKSKLGEIFDGLTKQNKKIAIKAKHGGTLSSRYKAMLADYIYEEILNGRIDWMVLSESKDIKTIIESLYDFILRKNLR